jgi:TonB family protein
MYFFPVFLITFLSLAQIPSTPAIEKEFLDKYYSPTTEERAVYYRICKRDDMKRLQGKVKIFRITGSLCSEMNYVDGLRDGYYAAYHANGNLATKGLYEVDNRLGIWEYWYDNHQKQREETYTPEGKLKIDNYWDNKGKQLLKNGTGFYEFTDELDVTTEKGYFKNYAKDGAWVGYFEDGKMYFQEEWQAGKLIKGVSHDLKGDTYTYTEAEYHTTPYFQGGMTELVKYLKKTMKYPKEAQRAGVEGKVSVRFIVDTEGNIKDVQLINSISYLNEEALRIVQTMPKWKPALLRGQKIVSQYVLPITFKLH